MRALIVEDEVRLAENIAAALRDGPGFAVDCCHTGTDGVLMAGQGQNDLLMLDLMLPGIDGMGIVRRSVVRGLQPMADQKQTTIRLDLGESWSIRMSPGNADILGSNLTMNAVQHSPLEAQIVVSVDSDGRAMELRVVDHGQGIPEAALQHVFEQFYCADESRSRNSTGLGPAICKGIVDRSRGAIAVESSPGLGTLARITFAISDKYARPSVSVKDLVPR